MDIVSENDIIYKNKTFSKLFKERLDSDLRPATFKDIFGDQSNLGFSSIFRLDHLNITSLEGSFAEVSNYIRINSNPGLTSLEHLPKMTHSGTGVWIEYCDIESLSGLSQTTIMNAGLIFLNGNTKLKTADLLKTFLDRREEDGNFDFLSLDHKALSLILNAPRISLTLLVEIMRNLKECGAFYEKN